MKALREMARLAADNHIMGGSFKRNSLLKPLDIIFDNLEREPKEEMRDVVLNGSAEQIFEHIRRISKSEFKPGKAKQDFIKEYVNIFFDGVLREGNGNDVNRLLQREKILRSAYLIYFREALPQKEKQQADIEQAEEVGQMAIEFAQ